MQKKNPPSKLCTVLKQQFNAVKLSIIKARQTLSKLLTDVPMQKKISHPTRLEDQMNSLLRTLGWVLL